MRILGIDPGSAATGYGVVELAGRAGAERASGRAETRRTVTTSTSGRRLVHVTHGVLRSDRNLEVAARLAALHDELARVVRETGPDVCVIERIFVAANARSALVLGQARGVALAALGEAGRPVREISAREVKKALVGTGSATKQQVQAMVKRLLELPKEPPTDASDALAIAISQAHAGPLASLGVRSGRSRRRTSLRAHFAGRSPT